MNFSHPVFAPYRVLIDSLGGETSIEKLNALAGHLGVKHGNKPLCFAASCMALSASEYEQSIATIGKVPTRENNVHDFLNALVWLRFPYLKTSLNLRHTDELAKHADEHKHRGKLRDQLTLLDESGLLVVSSNPELLKLLSAKCWTELFWEAREELNHQMHFFVVGHGLLEKCLMPFPGMTAKCLLLHTDEKRTETIDGLAAKLVQTAESLDLPPLPIQGIPGWDDNNDRGFYLNTSIFRPARTPPRSA